MPNTHSTLTALFSDIADSIRSKAGTSAHIVADAFPAAIDAIPSGDEVLNSILSRTISGSYTNINATQIGGSAFYGCSKLTEVYFPACTYIGLYCFDKCVNLRIASFPVAKTINASAFNGLSNLTEIYFPSCSAIGESAFYGCSKLTEAYFPACTSIPTNAFYGCYNLSYAYFPSAKSIGSQAFFRCSSMHTFRAKELTKLSSYAFAQIPYLLSFYILGSSVPNLQHINVFDRTPISDNTTSTGGVYGSIIVQASMLDAFKTATNWSLYSSRFSVWNGVD